MLDALLPALTTLLAPQHMLFMVIGVSIGLVVGLLPGLSGVAGFSLVVPFVYGMDPVSAMALLIGLVVVITISDTFTAVLMGIPGSGGGQATVLDGFPLARQGKAAMALSAAFSASMFGGLFGAVVLTVAIFVSRPMILAIGFGEQLMLVLLGLTMVGMMSGRSATKGIAALGVGLLLGSIGSTPATGEWRLAYDIGYLADGLPLVVVALGIFAIPEIIDLMRRRGTISGTGSLGAGWREGVREAIKSRWLILRCSGIGCLIGMLPGLGGSVVDWVGYGHTVQTTRDKSQFGRGEIRGVIGPEASANAKDGGALIPTLLFGIPGSGSMAVFLGALVLLGVEPGIGMIGEDLDLTYTIIWSIAIANVIGTGICLLFASQVARITTIPYAYLGPFMIILIMFAAFQATRSWGDILALVAIGVLGTYMRRFGWPRPALLIGFVLSNRLEVSLYQAIQVYGLSLFERPLVWVLGAITLVSAYFGVRFARRSRGAEEETAGRAGYKGQLLFAGVLAVLAGIAIWEATTLTFLSRVFPLWAGIITLAALTYVLVRMSLARGNSTMLHDEDVHFPQNTPPVPNEYFFVWIAALLGAAFLFGFPIGFTLFLAAIFTIEARAGLVRTAILSGGGLAFLLVMERVLNLRYPPGLLSRWMEAPWLPL